MYVHFDTKTSLGHALLFLVQVQSQDVRGVFKLQSGTGKAQCSDFPVAADKQQIPEDGFRAEANPVLSIVCRKIRSR